MKLIFDSLILFRFSDVPAKLNYGQSPDATLSMGKESPKRKDKVGEKTCVVLETPITESASGFIWQHEPPSCTCALLLRDSGGPYGVRALS